MQIFQLLWQWLAAKYWKQHPLNLFQAARSKHRVGLLDIDLNFHLNNAKYLKFMDKARFQHALDSGLALRMLQLRWNSVVANIEISYVRSLMPWQRFQVDTEMVGWDDKYFYVKQTFRVKDQVYAVALTRQVILVKGRPIDLNDAFAKLASDTPSPSLPDSVEAWKALIQHKKQESLNAG